MNNQPQLTHYLVAHAGCWGKAETLALAKANYSREAGRKFPREGVRYVYRCSADAYVDETGRFYASACEQIEGPR